MNELRGVYVGKEVCNRACVSNSKKERFEDENPPTTINGHSYLPVLCLV